MPAVPLPLFEGSTSVHLAVLVAWHVVYEHDLPTDEHPLDEIFLAHTGSQFLTSRTPFAISF